MSFDLALTDSGYNPKTGRYNFSKGPSGDVLFDETQAYPVMVSAVSVKGGYWADPQHGNLASNDVSLTASTPSQAEAATLDAEQPLVDAGLIKNVTATATARAPNGIRSALEVSVSWSTPGGSRLTRTVGR